MKQIIYIILGLFFSLNFAWSDGADKAEESTESKIPPIKCRPCSTKPNLFKSTYNLLNKVWVDGKNELYIPTYAWHNRFMYSKERVSRYNENPWGGGLGKSYYDDNGDWHGLYAFAFLDSHKNVEPIVGYAFLKILQINDNANVGGGFAVLVTSRPDINNGIPFPGALPWVSANYRRVTFVATYIPGAKGVGNVLFLITKILL
jgi:lipid IVA palmitoyltransferase